MRRWPLMVLALVLMIISAGCGGDGQEVQTTPTESVENTATPTVVPTPTPEPIIPFSSTLEGTEGYPWWNDRVFYEIFVRSFYDSDGDGIGDFQGLLQKLDYLNDGDPNTTDDLGITGIWLMPINPSPSYHGYDVTDYYGINPDYGTMEDFKEFLAEAHSRGIVVIIDLVLNHTSVEHPWFQASTDPNSEYREYYNWSESRPPLADWHEWDETGDYYYGLFWYGMPDLNYTNDAVTEDMFSVVDYWLSEIGVDGFRLDAAKHLIEDGSDNDNTPATHEWYKRFNQYYKSINPSSMTIGEIWDISYNVVEYLQGDELDLAFNFDLAEAYVRAARNGVSTPLYTMINRDISDYPSLQFGAFLTNHDQNRAMSQINSFNKSRIAAALLLTGPGVPFIYYGEELGMVGIKPDEDIRTPMQWESTANGGFTSGIPWRPMNEDYRGVNVMLESSSESSLLSWYRTLIHLRADHPALRVGEIYPVDAEDESNSVYSMLRVSDGEAILVLINLSEDPVSAYSLGFDEGVLADGSYQMVSLLDEIEAENLVVADGAFSSFAPLAALDPFQILIFQLVLE